MAKALAYVKGWRSTFLSLEKNQVLEGLRNIQYHVPPETESKKHEWIDGFKMQTHHCVGVVQALKKHRDLKPDLVVAHSGFGSTILVPEVLDCPIINYFEYYTRPRENDVLERKGFKHDEWYLYWRRAANAMTLLDLQTCTSGYSATRWQQQTFPKEYQPKIEVLFDGIDISVFKPATEAPKREVCGITIPENTRVVTYVSRGFESVRGFDIFMQVAKRIYTEMPNTIFLVAGKDRVCYGTDLVMFNTKSFKEYVLKQDKYDMSKFRFLDWIPVPDLVQLLQLSDLHLYLTAPFVLSWSLFNALACGATVLASDVGPVREIVKNGHNGLLCDLHDIDGLTRKALEVLKDPGAYKALGKAGAELMQRNYSFNVMLPKFIRYLEGVANGTWRPSLGDAVPAATARWSNELTV